jgi:molybdopterin-guanine dinucleotide biosynthesis protein A
MMTDVGAFILAGGKSTRMGTEKAFLEFAGTTLLDRTLDIARQVIDDVRIVGRAERFAIYGPIVYDVYPDRGPLGGIHAALRSSTTTLNLVLAVDMPFIEARFLRYLVEQARANVAAVTVPFAAGRFQTLCAVYRRSFADLAEESLLKNHNKIDPLFTAENTRVITQEEIERLAFPAAMFDNLNTREDVERARVRAEQR